MTRKGGWRPSVNCTPAVPPPSLGDPRADSIPGSSLQHSAPSRGHTAGFPPRRNTAVSILIPWTILGTGQLENQP